MEHFSHLLNPTPFLAKVRVRKVKLDPEEAEKEKKLEAQRARSRKSYRKHRDKVIARTRAYALANPEVGKAARKRYEERNREWVLLKKKLSMRKFRAKS